MRDSRWIVNIARKHLKIMPIKEIAVQVKINRKINLQNNKDIQFKINQLSLIEKMKVINQYKRNFRMKNLTARTTINLSNSL